MLNKTFFNFIKPAKFIIILVMAFFSLLNGSSAKAQTQLLPACAKSGACSLCDMVNVIIAVGTFALGIIGSIALLFFVYAGVTLLLSGGRSGEVTKGKNMMVNSAIGLIIVLAAYLIVNIIVTFVTGQEISALVHLQCAPPIEAPPVK